MVQAPEGRVPSPERHPELIPFGPPSSPFFPPRQASQSGAGRWTPAQPLVPAVDGLPLQRPVPAPVVGG